MGNKKVKNIIKIALSAVFWMALWQTGFMALGKSIILPAPFSVFKRLFELIPDKTFLFICFYSIGRIFIGLLAGAVIGTLLAVTTSVSIVPDGIFSPAVSVIKATPVASFIIVLLFVFSRDTVPTLAAMLMVIPIIYVNMRRGISSVPKEKKEVAFIYGFGFKKKLRLLYIPSVLPYFAAASRLSLGLAWKAGIAAEVICQPKNSIGTMLYDSKIYLESENLFAWTIVVIVLSIILEKAVMWLLGKTVKVEAEV